MTQTVHLGALFTGFGAGAGGFLRIRFIRGGSIDGGTTGGAVVTIGAG